MRIIQPRRLRFASLLLLLSFAIAPGLRAQDRAAADTASVTPPVVDPASVSVASSNLAADDSAQASPQQPGADVPLQTGPKQLTNYVEAGGDYLTLTNGFGYWAGGYARGVVTSGRNIWNGEVNGQHEFGDSGVYLAAFRRYL